MLSTARSYLFNELLAMRQRDGNWDRLLQGEVAMLDGTASQFTVDTVDDALVERASRLDLHPSGVLWGVGSSATSGSAAEYEQGLREHHGPLCGGLERAGVKLARRPLRMRLGEPRLAREPACLRLDFTLPRGSFATAVLRELIEHPTLDLTPVLA